MTVHKLTPQLIQEIYEEAVSAECFERENVDAACFDLLCKMDEAGGLSHVVRKLIDMVRAKEADSQKYQNAAATDRETLKRLAVIMSGNDSGGEINALTVTAKSLVDRCKVLAKEREQRQSIQFVPVAEFIGGVGVVFERPTVKLGLKKGDKLYVLVPAGIVNYDA